MPLVTETINFATESLEFQNMLFNVLHPPQTQNFLTETNLNVFLDLCFHLTALALQLHVSFMGSFTMPYLSFLLKILDKET